MIKPNVTKDAELLDIEIFDFDTSDMNETGINEDRMKLPSSYDISKYYKRNKRNREKGRWVKKSEEELPDFSSDFEWQITYNFPSTIRNNKTSSGATYGGANVTFRRLYLILCERFNGGRYFIDDYFDTIYPYTIKKEVDAKLGKIKADLLGLAEDFLEGAVSTKSGSFDKRYKINRGMKSKLKNYESFARAWEENEGIYLAKIIKEDIINCMLSGQLQMECVSHLNTAKTKRARVKAGLSSEPVFLATSRLIESLQLFVKIGGNRKWQTKQGILV